MSFFNNKDTSAAESVITVSGETRITVSDRMNLYSQTIEFDEDPASNKIVFITRENTQDDSYRCKKGLVLAFDKYIESGTYQVAPDRKPPFAEMYYFETGTNPGHINYFEYSAKSGSFTVEAIKTTTEKLHYKISFDLIGKLKEGEEELKIVGEATYIVLTRSV